MDEDSGAGVFGGGFDGVFIGGEDGAGPVENFAGTAYGGVDAAVAHPLAEIVVPVSAVDGVALIAEHVVRDVGEIVIGAEFFGAAFHGLETSFIPD